MNKEEINYVRAWDRPCCLRCANSKVHSPGKTWAILYCRVISDKVSRGAICDKFGASAVKLDFKTVRKQEPGERL